MQPKIDAYFVPTTSLFIVKHTAEEWMWATSILITLVLFLDILLGHFRLSEVYSTAATGLYHNLGLWFYFLNGQRQIMTIIINIHLQKFSLNQT